MRTSLALAAALLAATQAGAAYRCVDAKGRTHIGDTPPPGCSDVVMYEITRGGQVIRTIEPTLTPEQVKQKELEAAKKKEAERAAAEQKRKDDALMATFSSEKEFDVVRDRNIEPIRRSIAAAQERLKAIDKREKELADELEFYKAGKSGKKGKAAEPPRHLIDQQEGIKAERATLAKSIAGYEKEIGEIRAKFEVDKKRWVAIRGGGSKGAEAAEPKATPVADKAEKPRK